MTIGVGDTVRLREPLLAHGIDTGATGVVVRVCNGWLDVDFAGYGVVRGIDPERVDVVTKGAG